MTDSLQCDHCDSEGIRCQVIARWRIYFSKDHPFDFMDVCEDHIKEFPFYATRLNLETRELEERPLVTWSKNAPNNPQ